MMKIVSAHRECGEEIRSDEAHAAAEFVIGDVPLCHIEGISRKIRGIDLGPSAT